MTISSGSRGSAVSSTVKGGNRMTRAMECSVDRVVNLEHHDAIAVITIGARRHPGMYERCDR